MDKKALLLKLRDDVGVAGDVELKLVVIQDTLWSGITEYRCTTSAGETYAALDCNGSVSPFTRVPDRENMQK